MKTSALFVVAAFLLLAPARSDAQQLKLEINDGRVTLEAQNTSVRQILAEWSRVGGAKIVNAEKVTGAPVTLQLRGVPERQALDTILRGVSGYMLAARRDGNTGVSAFDRILILPTSSAPRGGAPANAGLNGGGRPMPMPMPAAVQAEPVEPEQELVEDADTVDADADEPEADGDAEAEAEEEEVVQPPQPGMNPRFQRAPNFPNPMGGQVQPFVTQPGPGQPVNVPDEDGQPATATPGFVAPVGGSAVPGVITPVPQQDPQQQQHQQQTPQNTTRPPRPPL